MYTPTKDENSFSYPPSLLHFLSNRGAVTVPSAMANHAERLLTNQKVLLLCFICCREWVRGFISETNRNWFI